MPLPSNMPAFLAVSVLLTLAPGPDILFVMAQGLSGGSARGVAAALGLATGLLVHTALAALGVSAVFLASAPAFAALKFAGTADLLWLAACAFREAPSPSGAPVSAGSHLLLYRTGIMMNLLNPKVALFFLALLPQFVDARKGGVPVQMALLGLMFIAQVLVIFGGLGWLAGRVGARLLPSGRWSRHLSAAKGVIFLSLALSIFLLKR